MTDTQLPATRDEEPIDPYALQRIPRHTDPLPTFYTQAQLDAAVLEAVEKERAWWIANRHRIVQGTHFSVKGERWLFMLNNDMNYRDYDSIDALISSEIKKEKL